MVQMRHSILLAAVALCLLRPASSTQPHTQAHASAAQLGSSMLGSRAVRAGSSAGGDGHGHGFELHNPMEFYRAANVRFDMGWPTRANLTVNTTMLQHSGQWVEVCWENVGFPATDDYVALIVPAHAALTETAPAKYQWAALSDTHLQEGRGCLK